MKSVIVVLNLLVFSHLCFAQSQDEVTQKRSQIILNAFNSRLDQLIEPLELGDIQLGAYDGRIVVNKKSKFTYYVQIEEAMNIDSKITLIPMSTSRFTATYYQTNDWWDAHKAEIDEAKRNGTPAPRQDIDEVATWLKEMKLDTNPDVLVIHPKVNKVERTPLNDFLLEVYLKNFVENGKVVLYRGAEKPNELDAWSKGVAPRGIRYWTPTANYAWRYARKNTQFLDLLLDNDTPLFRFEIPTEKFKAMVQSKWRQLTLGTELTKNAHQIFDRSNYFGDHLYSGDPFLGIGVYGVEFELRSNKSGAQEMAKYFKRVATISDLANDRIRVLESAKSRLQRQIPEKYELKYKAIMEIRISTVRQEANILQALVDHKSETQIFDLSRQVMGRSEIASIDGLNFASWVSSKAKIHAAAKCGELF
ncbi:MAG: hypothetical protein WA160_10520 [Pseudobdellovibrio sp.]